MLMISKMPMYQVFKWSVISLVVIMFMTLLTCIEYKKEDRQAILDTIDSYVQQSDSIIIKVNKLESKYNGMKRTPKIKDSVAFLLSYIKDIKRKCAIECDKYNMIQAISYDPHFQRFIYNPIKEM